MMGDKDYNQTVNNALDALVRETELQIRDSQDNKNIFLQEICGCMRRSYYDRFDKIEIRQKSFGSLFGGLIRKLPYGSKIGEFSIEEIKLKGQADMIVDDIIVIFRTVSTSPETPAASDILYVNSCMWIFNKTEGVIVYLAHDNTHTPFSVMREKKIFEEAIRRVRVYSNLISEKKVPILEPSPECTSCQYYERCFMKKNEGKQFSLTEMFGVKKK